jgi:hypothetical protein
MVEVAASLPSVYITKRVRCSGRVYSLALNSGFQERGKNLRISVSAVQQLKADPRMVEKLDAAGVRMSDENLVVLPFIYVRDLGVSSRGTVKIYVAQKEIDALAKCFKLEPAEASGAAYLLVTRRSDQNVISISPSWNEMVRPAWREQVRQLTQDPHNAPLPDPPRVCCRPLSRELFALPGWPFLFRFDPVLPVVAEGVCEFSRVGGWPRAEYSQGGSLRLTMYFHQGNVTKSYQQGSAGVGPLKRRSAAAADDHRYRALFGPNPKSAQAVIERKAGEAGLEMPALQCLKLLIRPAAPGVNYWVRFSRVKEKMKIECFRDEQLQQRHGHYDLPLEGGYPYQQLIALTTT